MSKKTILVADDAPAIALGFQFMFHDEKYSFLKAYNGKDACQLAVSHKPELIILEILMPEGPENAEKMSPEKGVELFRKLKTDSKTRNIPVIILSAMETSRIDSHIKTGAMECFAKPFYTDEMHACVTKILDGNSERRSCRAIEEPCCLKTVE